MKTTANTRSQWALRYSQPRTLLVSASRVHVLIQVNETSQSDDEVTVTADGHLYQLGEGQSIMLHALKVEMNLTRGESAEGYAEFFLKEPQLQKAT